MLLDTCAAIWLMARAPMSDSSREAVRQAQSANVGVYVSPISAWEIGTLVSKGRLQLALAPEIWFETLVGMPGVRLAPLSPGILFASTTLPGTPPTDPADRIVAATARLQGHVIITRDKKLLAYASEGHIRTICC